mgnify:CR=1 FL=1
MLQLYNRFFTLYIDNIFTTNTLYYTMYLSLVWTSNSLKEIYWVNLKITSYYLESISFILKSIIYVIWNVCHFFGCFSIIRISFVSIGSIFFLTSNLDKSFTVRWMTYILTFRYILFWRDSFLNIHMHMLSIKI